MLEKHKLILERGNAAISQGNHEGMLSLCTEDTEWTFVGDEILKGKEAVRQYMAITYIEPPKFTVTNMIAEGDFVTVVGEITLKNEDGKDIHHSYCDVWQFHDEQIAKLWAYVIKTDVQ
jgi:uncharacterized protein